MMKSNLIGVVLEKGIPRKRSVFGGLASPARFERAASRLGELAFQVIKKPGQYLEKLDFSSNFGKF